MSEIFGYKAFDEDGTTISGDHLDEGCSYHYDGPVKFGKSGFHMAVRLEDTIRYSSNREGLKNPTIALVVCFGELDEGYDHYNGYYDMYAASDIAIIRYLTRREIIEYALKLDYLGLARFLSLYELTEDEINLFYGFNSNIDKIIDYYQRGDKDAFNR